MEGLDWLKEAALTEERIEKTRKLSALASRLEMSMPRLAIAWCLKNPNVSTVILGASKTAHLLENLKALEDQEKLNEDVMTEIDSILENRPVFPNF
jgi:aryl-alcohol dehydrogenase-like predicted oxidoreductase